MVPRMREWNLLDDLLDRYRDNGKSLKGYESLLTILTDEKGQDLSQLLFPKAAIRSYQYNTLLSDVSSLLNFYSLLEIASTIKIVPDPLPENVKDEIAFVLADETIIHLFRENTPSVLLILLSKRIHEGGA